MLRGDLATAASEATRAQREYPTANSGWGAKLRILQAEILTDQGSSDKVIALLHSGTLSSGNSDEVIRSKTLCALAYARLGQSQQSEQELQEAQSLSDASHSELDGQILLTRGLIDLHYDRLSNAGSSLQKSIDVSRQRGDRFLEEEALLNLGTVALRNEHYDEAMRRFRETSELASTIHDEATSEMALTNQGWAYYKLGDFEKSLGTFEQAEKQAERLGLTDDKILCSMNAGLALYELHDLNRAETYYLRAMKAAEAIRDEKAIGDSHLDLGFLYLQQDKLALAQEHSDEALKFAKVSGSKSDEVEPLFLQGMIASRQPDKPEALRILLHVYEMTAARPSLRWRVENAFANLYAETEPQQAELWFQRSIHTFETQRSTLNDVEQKLPFFANADVLYKDYAEYLIRSNRSNEALRLLDVARARTLQEGLGPVTASIDSVRLRTADPRKIARKLDSTIFFYSLSSRRSYLWSINANSVQLFQLPPQSEIEKSVSDYQKAILRSDDPMRHSNAEATYLYDKLVAPAASTITPGSRVILMPDGDLNLLNFETLVTRDNHGEHYWIEDVTLTNASSIRLLSASSTPARQTNSGRLLLIGDPVSPAPEYAALANASVEVSSIEKHFAPDSRTVLTQDRAIPTAYSASRPDQFTYIHFVAHATASRLSPMDSAVVLSAIPAHADSYKLYARDIVSQPIHADLVTISSCYGSGSRAYAGEGLVGLSWAFLRAGSHHVIGALWEADDASTSRLMDRLYSELGAGARPDAALREAKLALIHSAGLYRKPYYWAAFQLQSGS